MTKLGRYLSPPAAKLKAKGVESVRARVTNLCNFVPELTKDALCEYLVTAAENVYGLKAQELQFTSDMEEAAHNLTKHYASDEWRFGANVSATFCCEKTFYWGTVSFEFLIEHDIITNVSVYTDAMEWELSGRLKAALEGQKFSLSTMISSVASSEIEPNIREDISGMLAEQEI